MTQGSLDYMDYMGMYRWFGSGPSLAMVGEMTMDSWLAGY